MQRSARNGYEACLECVGKPSSPLATSAAECIQTKRPARTMLTLDLWHIDRGRGSDSDHAGRNIGPDRLGYLAPTNGADNDCAGRCRCSGFHMDCGDDSPADSNGATYYANGTIQTDAKKKAAADKSDKPASYFITEANKHVPAAKKDKNKTEAAHPLRLVSFLASHRLF